MNSNLKITDFLDKVFRLFFVKILILKLILWI